MTEATTALRVAIVGGHGKIALLLTRLLSDRGDEAIGVVRKEEHSADIEAAGGTAAIVDIESASAKELAAAFTGVDAVVFAAGAGAGSTAERKQTVDYGGSVLAAQAASLAGVTRFVQISAINVDAPLPADTEPVWAAYVVAKRDADIALRATDLDWTILRPGALTDEPGTGNVAVWTTLGRGSISRQDVAATIAAVLHEPGSIGKVWDVVGGDTPLAESLERAILAS